MENEFQSNLSLISNITQYGFRFSLTFSLAEIFAENVKQCHRVWRDLKVEFFD